MAAFAWWAAGMIVLAFVDLTVLRPPHRLTSAGLLPLLAATGDTSASLRAVTAAAVLAVFFAVLAVASRGQLGWGDVAIAVPLAAALGWHKLDRLLRRSPARPRRRRRHHAQDRTPHPRSATAPRFVPHRRRCRHRGVALEPGGVAMTGTPNRYTRSRP
ncbi:prepilin peptidase [Dactylosporangium sp. NPDC000555]|uniref:prepilin peptidase n=1 Tax=Dactylosporangium sp. NPDC000555 TaxID=3154260 RepID=UPI00331F45F2